MNMFAYGLGYRLVKSGFYPIGLSPMMTKVLQRGALGAGIGGTLGAIYGLIGKKDDKKSRLAHVLQQMLRGGAITGIAGGLATAIQGDSAKHQETGSRTSSPERYRVEIRDKSLYE